MTYLCTTNNNNTNKGKYLKCNRQILFQTFKTTTMSGKSKIFNMAWTILKSGWASSFSQALKKAWIIAKMYTGKRSTITFAKETGELREATAIISGSLDTLESGFIRFVESFKGAEAQWRSFRIERLIA